MRYNFSCLVFESQLFDVDLYFKFNITNQKLLQQTQQQQANAPGFALANAYSFGLSLTANTNLAPGHPSNANPFGNAPNGQGGGNNAGSSGSLAAFPANFNYQNSADVFGSCLAASGCGSSNRDLMDSLPQSVGLLEVLPLNFKHFSCSNGTQMDKGGSGKQETNLYVLPDFFSVFEKSSGEEERHEGGSSEQNQVAMALNLIYYLLYFCQSEYISQPYFI